MRAVSCCSGGVMFVPDEIERETKSVSYKDLAGEEEAVDASKGAIFNKQKASEKGAGNSVCAAA